MAKTYDSRQRDQQKARTKTWLEGDENVTFRVTESETPSPPSCSTSESSPPWKNTHMSHLYPVKTTNDKCPCHRGDDLISAEAWRRRERRLLNCCSPPGDVHAYNDVCFKGDITSQWWKCVSPCVTIIGPNCSYLCCARLRLSRSGEWLKGWFWGIDTMTFMAGTNFLIATFITWTSNKARLTVAVPQTHSRRTHVSLKFLFNTFWARNNLFTSTVCTQFLLSL